MVGTPLYLKRICNSNRIVEIPVLISNGGEKGIRTPERVNPLTVFETAAFDHSAISPD